MVTSRQKLGDPKTDTFKAHSTVRQAAVTTLTDILQSFLGGLTHFGQVGILLLEDCDGVLPGDGNLALGEHLPQRPHALQAGRKGTSAQRWLFHRPPQQTEGQLKSTLRVFMHLFNWAVLM